MENLTIEKVGVVVLAMIMVLAISLAVHLINNPEVAKYAF